MPTNTTNIRSGRSVRRLDLVEPELSYHVVGALFRVYNAMGPGLQEKLYQRALAKVFRDLRIAFREQASVPVSFEHQHIGRHIIDFVVADRVVLEIKQGDFCSPDHIGQVKRYLTALALRLGILANFGSQRVVYRRILAPEHDS